MKTHAINCLLALTMMLGAQAKDAEVGQIFPESFIQSWGYRTTKNGPGEQSKWEIKHFGRAVVRLQSIKSIKELKDWKDAYYRFRIGEETFSTPEEAKRRIDKIKDTPPGLDTKTAPNWELCDGIAVGKVAYIVSTDSVKFQLEELPTVMKLLTAKVTTK